VRWAVLHPVVRELRVFPPVTSLRPVSSPGRIRVGAEILDDSSHGVWVPFDENSSSNRNHAGLPRQHHPFSGFLTLPTVSSCLGLVVLFHTTSVHRILAFRAFPSQSAAAPFDARYSLVVGASNHTLGKQSALSLLFLGVPEILFCSGVHPSSAPPHGIMTNIILAAWVANHLGHLKSGRTTPARR
jgi:hypothetical protein